MGRAPAKTQCSQDCTATEGDQRSRLTIRRSSSLVKIETDTLSGCHAVPNTVGNSYAAISRPGQKNAWQTFKSLADCRQPVEVPHLILGHGPLPAVDPSQQRGLVNPEYFAQLHADEINKLRIGVGQDGFSSRTA